MLIRYFFMPVHPITKAEKQLVWKSRNDACYYLSAQWWRVKWLFYSKPMNPRDCNNICTGACFMRLARTMASLGPPTEIVMNTKLAARWYLLLFLIDFMVTKSTPRLYRVSKNLHRPMTDQYQSVVVVLSNSYAIFRTWEGGIANLYRLT